MNWLESYNGVVSGVLVPLALVLAGGYFLVVLRGVWLHPIRLCRRMLVPTQQGGTSPLRAWALPWSLVLPSFPTSAVRKRPPS